MPDVFVDAEGGDLIEPGLVVGEPLQHRLHVRPHGPPRHPELTSQAPHGRVLPSHLPDRPRDRAGRERAVRLRDDRVLLGERTDRAALLAATPTALAPPDTHRPRAHRRVGERERLPARRLRDHPAPRAPRRARRGLGIDQQPTAVTMHAGHVQAVQADKQIAAGAVRRVGRASGGAPRRVRHGSRTPGWNEAWSLPILGASTRPTRHATRPTPTQNPQSP